jgi:hypothetical protein
MAKSKTATKKAKLRVVKAPKISYGQKGGKLDLELSDLNAKERKLLGVFNPNGARGEYMIEHLAMVFGREAKNRMQAQSWVRNSLRRLVRGKLVEHVGDGTYRMTLMARAMVKKSGLKQVRRAA